MGQWASEGALWVCFEPSLRDTDHNLLWVCDQPWGCVVKALRVCGNNQPLLLASGQWFLKMFLFTTAADLSLLLSLSTVCVK
jgi:hypothetical protein